MTWREFLSFVEYYFATLGVPGLVIACFVLYVYLKERYRKL